jgi:hypothetical protein
LDSLARELFQLEGRNQTSGQEFTSCRHQRGTPEFDTSTPFFAHFQEWPPYESIT